MSIPLKYRQVLVRTGMIGFGTYVLYKMIMPSEKHLQKFKLEPGELDNHNRKANTLGRVRDLSSQGYSFEAITRIIDKERKLHYENLYADELRKRKKLEEEMEKNKQKEKTIPSLLLEDVTLSTARTLLGIET